MRLQRIDWLIIALITFACGGALAYEYWPESPRFEVVDADRELNGLKAGTTVPLNYAVRNLGSDPMRVVGATYS